MLPSNWKWTISNISYIKMKMKKMMRMKMKMKMIMIMKTETEMNNWMNNNINFLLTWIDKPDKLLEDHALFQISEECSIDYNHSRMNWRNFKYFRKILSQKNNKMNFDQIIIVIKLWIKYKYKNNHHRFGGLQIKCPY